MPNVTMTRLQYDALINAAVANDQAELARLQRIIDAANGIKRYTLVILWQDVGGKPPPRIEFGKGWPDQQKYKLVLERPIARTDVDEVLRQQAKNPVTVMVTPDPNGVLGLTLIDDYDFLAGG